VEENFSARRMAEGYLALYERIIEEVAIGEALSVVKPGMRGEESVLLTQASQLAKAAPSRQDQEGPRDEELAVA
jgi:hypothetical protein